jgi:hypothetical protein
MFAFGIRPVDKGTADLMLDGDRSRGYCLEIICANFLAEHIWRTELLKYCAFDPAVLQVPARRAKALLASQLRRHHESDSTKAVILAAGS